jgi:hypothetical protein
MDGSNHMVEQGGEDRRQQGCKDKGAESWTPGVEKGCKHSGKKTVKNPACGGGA